MSSESTIGEPGSGRHRGSHHRVPPVVIKTVCVLAALLSITAFVGFGYAWYNYTSFDGKVHRLSGIQVVPAAEPAATPGQKHVNGTEQNILLVGDDSRDGLTPEQIKQLHVGSDSATNSTDTILLVHVPADGSRATLISIPRDSYVAIPGYGMNKINGAYADGYNNNAPGKNPTTKAKQTAGADLLIKTVTKLTGVGINRYIQVGFGGFYTIANAIGGINVNLCHAVDDTAARNREDNPGAGPAGSGFKMSAGHHHLSAAEALEFVRQRHNIPGPVTDDIGREQRQRYFLAQAFNAMTSRGILFNPLKLNRLENAIAGAFFTDGGFELAPFASQMLDLNSEHIVGQTIPIVNVNGHVGNQDVVLVDPGKVQAKVKQIIDGSAPPVAPGSSSKTSKASAGPTPSSGSSASTRKARKPVKDCID